MFKYIRIFKPQEYYKINWYNKTGKQNRLQWLLSCFWIYANRPGKSHQKQIGIS